MKLQPKNDQNTSVSYARTSSPFSSPGKYVFYFWCSIFQFNTDIKDIEMAAWFIIVQQAVDFNVEKLCFIPNFFSLAVWSWVRDSRL